MADILHYGLQHNKVCLIRGKLKVWWRTTFEGSYCL